MTENMNLEDGKRYTERLISISKGILEPAADAPIEQILFDVLQSMRTTDEKLANDCLDAVIFCMKCQVHERRLTCTNIHELLEYRGEEGGAK